MIKPAAQWATLALLVTAALPAFAQAPPQLQAIFPPGGKAGQTVQVVLRGGIGGARDMLVFGQGLDAKIERKDTKSDPASKKLFEEKCATCHELRGPHNRQMSPNQWEATVDRMINSRGADIGDADKSRILDFLKAESAAGLVTGEITIASDAAPGRREVRVVTPDGVSTALPFYVSSVDEAVEQEPNDDFDKAKAATLPVVLNGVCERNGDRDLVKFDAKAGQRLLFRASAYSLNPDTQNYFDACLFLYDANQKLVARSLGYEDLDPLIDFKVEQAGTYYVECRDLMYRGGAANVYRLEAGELGYKQSIYPLGAQRGSKFDAVIYSANQPERAWKGTVPQNEELGVQDLVTPHGLFRFHVSDLPDVYDNGTDQPQRISAPCAVNGWLGKDGEADRYVVSIGRDEVKMLRRWAVVGPFEAGDDGLEAVFPPETDALRGQVDPARSYQAKDEALTWETKEPGNNGIIGFPNGSKQTWYAHHTFRMEQDAAGLLSLGTDDAAKVWVNGELVFVFKGARAARPANELIPIKLRRGNNAILLKVLNVSGGGGFVAAAGAWSIEVFARRLGSPVKPVLKIGFGNDWVFQSTLSYHYPSKPGGDVRADWSFTQEGDYGIEISDEDKRGGDLYAYRCEIRPALPELGLRAYPGNPSVPRGGQVPIFVERTSLAGYSGDVTIKAEGLPAGVTAEPVVLPADSGRAVLVLKAAANAQAAASPVRILGEVPALGGPVAFEARPEDHYRIQNNAIPIRRRSMVAAAVPQDAPYTLSVSPAQLVARAGQRAQVQVTMTRRQGFGADVVVTLRGLPDGIGSNTTVLRGNKNDATLDITFPGNLKDRPFGGSLQKDVYQAVVVGLSGGDGLSGGMMYCSNPLTLVPQAAGQEARPQPRPDQPSPAMPAMSPAAQAGQTLMEQRCTRCHALVDPLQTRKSYAAWGETVERMIGKGARLNAQEQQQLMAYFKAVTDQQQKK